MSSGTEPIKNRKIFSHFQVLKSPQKKYSKPSMLVKVRVLTDTGEHCMSIQI